MIVHVDMDAFYASIEERADPSLRGKPVIVGGAAEGRGVVSAANYVARTYGVHSAMPSVTARRLCPNGIYLPVRMSYYAEVSRQIRAIFERFTPLVEPLALDEAFLDLTGSTTLFGPVEKIARTIKETILQELHLVASVGVAPNKFLAKLASDVEKPDGFVVVAPDRVQEFLDPLPVTRLWGVGKAAAKTLKRLGIERIGQLRNSPESLLQDHFGQNGTHLLQLAQGIDDRPVVPDRQAKSISHETTFAADVESLEVLRSRLLALTEQVAARLRRADLVGRTVQLKIRYGDFTTYTRAAKLPEPSNSTDALWHTVDEIVTTRLPTRPLAVRLIGVGVTNLSSRGGEQGLLFDDDERRQREEVDSVTDAINRRFGGGAVRRGGGMAGDE